jgi:transcriptional regulator with XRE-family HTH domain
MTVNAIIRRLRESKGLNQQNVADELGVNITSIVRWETDGESIKSNTLKKLADLFGVKISDIYTYEQNPSIFEEPIEYYRSKKKNISLVIDLDGTEDTLSYWIMTLKKLNTAL